ncbi:MAG: TonB family protein [Acidobacteriota bacterium]
MNRPNKRPSEASADETLTTLLSDFLDQEINSREDVSQLAPELDQRLTQTLRELGLTIRPAEMNGPAIQQVVASPPSRPQLTSTRSVAPLRASVASLSPKLEAIWDESARPQATPSRVEAPPEVGLPAGHSAKACVPSLRRIAFGFSQATGIGVLAAILLGGFLFLGTRKVSSEPTEMESLSLDPPEFWRELPSQSLHPVTDESMTRPKLSEPAEEASLSEAALLEMKGDRPIAKPSPTLRQEVEKGLQPVAGPSVVSRPFQPGANQREQLPSKKPHPGDNTQSDDTNLPSSLLLTPSPALPEPLMAYSRQTRSAPVAPLSGWSNTSSEDEERASQERRYRPPRLLSPARPKYPETAERLKISGTVMVRVLVDPEGKVVSAKAVSGPSTLRTTAEDAVLRCRFESATLDGENISGKATVSVVFSPRTNQ